MTPGEPALRRVKRCNLSPGNVTELHVGHSQDLLSGLPSSMGLQQALQIAFDCEGNRRSHEPRRERGCGGGREGGEWGGQRERENSNSKTLFYKDCGLGSVKNLSNN